MPFGVTNLVLTRMGGRHCAISCEHVIEIIPRVLLDHVPDAPGEVLGVINLRGRVVPVIDMRARVSQKKDLPVYQHLVIIRAQTKQLALAVAH